MSNKSQINNMSKKEILQALAYQQNQDMAAMNRFLIALAQAAGVKPEEFAKFFMAQDGNREYAEKLNAAIDEMAARNKEATPIETESTTSES